MKEELSSASLGRKAVISALILELSLVVVGFGICYFFGGYPNWNLNFFTSLVGVGGAIILMIAIREITTLANRYPDASWARQILFIKNEFATPLARSLSPSQMVYVSVLAGLCEEFFFRGAIESQFVNSRLAGAFVGGIAFVLLHFGQKTLEWRFVSALYFAVSLLFSGVFHFTDSLWAAAISHGLYDYLALRILLKTAKI